MSFGPIQKDVPIPSTRGKLRCALDDLAVGDSRFIEGYKATYIRTAAQRNGITVRARPEGGGVRVWRIS